MITLTRIFTAAAATVAAATILTTTASAQESVKVEFRYSAASSVEENYRNFERTAKRACKFGSALGNFSRERECRENLISSAVAATGRSALTAYHQQIGNELQPVSLTSR